MSDECKGYACPPSTTVDLPECEDGWEIGNGTAVCATQQPSSQLAITGGQVDPAALVLAGVLIAAGLFFTGWWLLIRRAERRIPQEAAEAQRQALADLDAMMAGAGSQVGRKLDHDLGEPRP